MVQIRSTSCYSDSYNDKNVGICEFRNTLKNWKWYKTSGSWMLNNFWSRGRPEKLDGMEPLSSLCDRILQSKMHWKWNKILYIVQVYTKQGRKEGACLQVSESIKWEQEEVDENGDPWVSHYEITYMVVMFSDSLFVIIFPVSWFMLRSLSDEQHSSMNQYVKGNYEVLRKGEFRIRENSKSK